MSSMLIPVLRAMRLTILLPFLASRIAEVAQEAGTYALGVITNIPDYEASSNAVWLTATVDGSNVNLTYEANTAITQRNATVTAVVTAGAPADLVETVVVVGCITRLAVMTLFLDMAAGPV